MVHNGVVVNAIIEEECVEIVKEVTEGKTQMMIVMKKLQDHGFLRDLYNNCRVCEMELDKYDKLKGYV